MSSEEEVWIAVGKLRNGKAGGASDILPEMMNAACYEDKFVSWLMELVHVQVIGVMLSWYPSLRKGDEQVMGKWWLWSFRRDYRHWLRKSFLKHSVDSGRVGVARVQLVEKSWEQISFLSLI